MKKIFTISTAGAMLLGVSTAVFANDGIINFTGVISAASCSVSSVAGESSTSGTVDFGTVSNKTFGTAGSRTTGTPFSIALTDCAVSSAPSITFNGDAVSASGYSELFASNISGLGIRIGDAGSTSTIYTPGTSAANSGLNVLSNGVTQATGNFIAWLVDYTGSSNYTGTLDTDVTFTIDYADS